MATTSPRTSSSRNRHRLLGRPEGSSRQALCNPTDGVLQKQTSPPRGASQFPQPGLVDRGSTWHEWLMHNHTRNTRIHLGKRTWILFLSRRGTCRPYFTGTGTCRDTENCLRADTPMRRIGSFCYITTSIRHHHPSVWSSPLSAPKGMEESRPASWPATSASWDCHLLQYG